MTLNCLDQIPSKITSTLGPIRSVCFPEQGYTSRTICVESSAGRFMLKHTTSPRFSLWLQTEYQVLAILSTSSALIPRPVMFHACSEADCWLVMEHLPGVPAYTALQREAHLQRRQRIQESLGAALRSIHEILPERSLPQQNPPSPEIPEYGVPGCSLVQPDTDSVPGGVADIPFVEPRLIHGDFTLRNVLVSGTKVTGIVDWPWGTIGDPRFDLAVATRPLPHAFGSSAEIDAFYAGYGAPPLRPDEYRFFIGLYQNCGAALPQRRHVVR